MSDRNRYVSRRITGADVVPEELVEDILSRLPVKSLLRFKTASRKWHSLIFHDDHFAKLHLNQSPPACKTLTFFQTLTGIILFTNFKSFQLLSEILFPVVIPNPRFKGSANGLICIASFDEKSCFLWNPSTLFYKRIRLPTDGSYIIGFGYDSVSDDYKIVGQWDSKFHVSSLKANAWKLVETNFRREICMHAVSLNGALHWQVDPITIAAFELTKEKFFFMKLAEKINFLPCMLEGSLFVNQGCLCVCDRKTPVMTIWVMKEYNVAESWVKLCTVLAPTEGKPVCLTDRAGRVVVAYQRWDTTHTRATLAKYNAHGKVVGDGDFDELSIFSGDSCLITFQNSESLIWPKYLDVDNGTVPVQARVMWRKYLDVNKVTVPVGARVENSKSLMWPKYLDVNKVTLPVRAPVKEEEEKSSKHATSMVILLIALFAGLLILAVLE